MSSSPRHPPVRSGDPVHEVEPADALVIDCDTCVMQESDACSDCVMSFLLDHEPLSSTVVILDLNEIRALRALGDAGLVPTLRHRASG